MEKVFPSRRDAWIVALIWAGALACLFAASEQFSGTAPLIVRLGLTVLFGAAAAFMLWVLYSIEYRLRAADLLICCGPMRYSVPLAEIDSVSPSRSPFSSPAASLDRLLIQWQAGRRKILVSPSPKADFLHELHQRCPHLQWEGESLARVRSE